MNAFSGTWKAMHMCVNLHSCSHKQACNFFVILDWHAFVWVCNCENIILKCESIWTRNTQVHAWTHESVGDLSNISASSGQMWFVLWVHPFILHSHYLYTKSRKFRDDKKKNMHIKKSRKKRKLYLRVDSFCACLWC